MTRARVVATGIALAVLVGGAAWAAARASTSGGSTSAAPGSTGTGPTGSASSRPRAVGPPADPMVGQGAGVDDAVPIGVPQARAGDGSRGQVQFQTGSGWSVLGEKAAVGSVVAAGNLDDDDVADMVVGSPQARGGAGQVQVFYGGGNPPASRTTLIPPPGRPGEHFGAAVAVGVMRAGGRDVWVGAPDEQTGDRVEGGDGLRTGAVYRYTVGPGGTVTLRDRMTETSLGGFGAADDRFGQVIDVGPVGVAVGVPGADVVQNTPTGEDRTLPDAGMLVEIRVDPVTGEPVLVTVWRRGFSLPGRPHAGDRFGASVAGGGTVVGVPGQDVGGKVDAGAVQVFGSTPTGGLYPAGTVTLDSPLMPGPATAGDRFGQAVASDAFDCGETLNVAVGAPGRDRPGARDAGSVVLFRSGSAEPNGTATSCRAKELGAGRGLPGRPEGGAHLGEALGVRRGPAPADGDDFPDALLIGAPGTDGGRGEVIWYMQGRSAVWRYQGTATGPVGFGSDLPG